MIVEACIFSPSLTRQLHYHSQLDKSVVWLWKSNEDNLLWILWMRSQFTWKLSPALTVFLLILIIGHVEDQTRCFKTEMKNLWEIVVKSCTTLEILWWFGPLDESNLTSQLHPDSSDVLSPPPWWVTPRPVGWDFTCDRHPSYTVAYLHVMIELKITHIILNCKNTPCFPPCFSTYK